MRILVDYRPALRARTGVGEYLHTIVRAYAAAYDDTVTVFTSSWKDRPPATLGTELGARVVDRRVPVSMLNYLWHRAGWPPVELLAGEADVVHAAHPLLIPSRHAAQVITIHDLFFLDRPEHTRAEIKRDYPDLARTHAQRADAIVTSSAHTKDLVSTRFGVASDRIHVCPPGAPAWTALGQGANVPENGYVLFLGTLEPRKNLGVVLDAYLELIQRSGRVLPLVIAGGAASDGNEWLQRIAAEPLKAHVTYRGYVAASDRERLYSGARALVLPSLDEGFGLTALEAMSAGVPVIASNRGSLPEVIGSGGLLLDALDVAAWASAIDRVASDRQWGINLGCAGLERARAFTWERAAAQLHDAYASAVTRRRQR